MSGCLWEETITPIRRSARNDAGAFSFTVIPSAAIRDALLSRHLERSEGSVLARGPDSSTPLRCAQNDGLKRSDQLNKYCGRGPAFRPVLDRVYPPRYLDPGKESGVKTEVSIEYCVV